MTNPSLASNANTTIASKLAVTAAASKAPIEEKDLVVAEKFQEYKSARSSMRLITFEGIRITFTNFKLLTQNEDVINYLDDEIKKGLPGVIKGALLTLADVNPMETMRREMELKVRAEIAEEAKQAALGTSKDMGTYATPKLNPAGSDTTAS